MTLQLPAHVYGVVLDGYLVTDLTPSLGEAENWVTDIMPKNKFPQVHAFTITDVGPRH